jgi:3-oxoadipate enol-lactonase
MSVCEVHHVVEGPADSPVVVLLNSLGADLAMWEPQAAALRDRFRVVRFDARGHGASPVPPGPYSLADLGADLLALLDRLEVDRAALLGVSLGGATAAWVAAHAPERVERLGDFFSSARFDPTGAYLERAALVRAEGTGAVAAAVVERWLTPVLRERNPALAARMRAMIAATVAEGYAASAEAVSRADLRGDLARITAPTLVVSGSEDPATPPEHGRALAAGIPGARFVELAGAAHLGNVERPDEVTGLILDHLSAPPTEAKEVLS